MLKQTFLLRLITVFGILIALNACKENSHEDEKDYEHSHDISKVVEESNNVQKAICVLYPTEGNEVKGTVTFEQSDSGVVVMAIIEGLTPGKHGFHIHEFGDCSAPNGTSAGGHFNPEGEEHGSPMGSTRHAGDLGNLIADDEGLAQLEHVDTHLKFSGKNSIIGMSIIVHENEDDLVSQPTGNAGARVACGVIGIAK